MKKRFLIFCLAFAAIAMLHIQAQCYTPAYPKGNMILDPGFDSTTLAKGGYGGWGVTGVPGIVTPGSAYCGPCAFVRGTCWQQGGSLDRTLAVADGNALKPLTKYRVRAMVKATAAEGKYFQIQVEGVDGADSKYFYIGNTNGWKQIDTTFVTGATVTTGKGIYFNSCTSSTPALTDTAFLDNYEMYAVPKVYPSSSALTILGAGSKKVAVRAENLSENITISATTGFTVSPTTMLSTVSGASTDSLTVTYSGTVTKTGYVYFTSGSVKDSMQVTATLAPTLVTSVPFLSLDEANNSGTFTVTGGNLTAGITMSAPAGITLTPSTLPMTANGATVTVTYDGAANSTGYITLTSTTATTRVRIRATRNADSFTPLYTSTQATNIITDPYMNDIANFGGWGSKAINTDTLFVYGGSKSGKVYGGQCGGSLDKVLTGIMKTNTKYRTRAMVYAIGGSFQVGVYGWDSSKGDTTQVISTTGSWQTVDMEFTTGATLKSGGQGVFFNSCWTGGTTGYIDNWELYEVPINTAVNSSDIRNQRVYADNHKIVTDFNLAASGNVEIAVYNVQGMQISKQNGYFNEGSNHVVLDATVNAGMYIVRISQNGKFTINKIVL